MRIAFSSTYQRLTNSINQKSEDLSRLTVMAGSTSRLLKQADDPLAWSQAMDFRQAIRQLESYQKNVDFALGWNQTTESALNQIGDLVVRAKNLGIQAISAQSSEKRQAQSEALNQIVQEAATLAGSQYADRYIFSGQSFNTAPYTLTKDPGTGEVLTVSTYQGDPESLEVRVGNGELQTVNQKGPEVFGEDGDDNLLQQLLNLKNAVRDGDTNAVQQAIAAVDTSYQNLLAQTSIVGVRQQALDDKTQIFESIQLQEESQLSDVADADMAELITQLQQKQTLFEAVLRITSMVTNLNLTKYL